MAASALHPPPQATLTTGMPLGGGTLLLHHSGKRLHMHVVTFHIGFVVAAKVKLLWEGAACSLKQVPNGRFPEGLRWSEAGGWPLWGAHLWQYAPMH